MLQRHLFFSIFVLLAVSGCTNEVFLTKPTLALNARPEPLTPALAISVEDDQSVQRGVEYSGQFLNAIHSAYPAATEINVAPMAMDGRVNVIFHIRLLGAFFNRSRNSLLGNSPQLTDVTGSVGDWGPVIAAATKTGPIATGSVFAFLPGNWSGITYIEVEVRDLRPKGNASFVFPLAAERSRPNQLGYLEASIAASSAWDDASPRLVSFLDAAIRKVRADQ